MNFKLRLITLLKVVKCDQHLCRCLGYKANWKEDPAPYFTYTVIGFPDEYFSFSNHEWKTEHTKHIDGLAQDCSNSNALAREILQSCTKPSTCRTSQKTFVLVYIFVFVIKMTAVDPVHSQIFSVWLHWLTENLSHCQRIHLENMGKIHLDDKSRNATVQYCAMLHSEQKFAYFWSEWSIVGYRTGAFWALPLCGTTYWRNAAFREHF